MKLFNKCCYSILVTILIFIIVSIQQKDKEDEVKYYSGISNKNKKGCKMLKTKAGDGALSGLIMGSLTGGPVTGLAMAARYGIVNPIIGGIRHLKDDNDDNDD